MAKLDTFLTFLLMGQTCHWVSYESVPHTFHIHSSDTVTSIPILQVDRLKLRLGGEECGLPAVESVAGPVKAVSGTLVTHLQQSGKRRAEVGGRITISRTGRWLHGIRHLKADPRGCLHPGGDLEGGSWEKVIEVSGQG